MAVAADSLSVAPGFLRSPGFDALLLGGLTAAALAAGGLGAADPAWLAVVLLADNWLLGFPHVAATFTRLVPDRASVRQHRFLVFGLPVLVVGCTAALALGLGLWAVGTVYFYWQWYHTVRQSWGVAQLYRRKSPVPVGEDPRLAEALFYLVPIWGLLHRLTTAHDHFLLPSLPIAVPVVPAALADGVGLLAGLGLAWWLVQRIREAAAGRLPLLHTLYAASHYLVFYVGYVALDDLAGGWVVTNIWHTAQYLMLVWLFNENQLARGQERAPGTFWSLSHGNRAGAYYAMCFLGALPVYAAITWIFHAGASGLLVAIVLNQTLNFHHFIVDSVIWRLRKRPAGIPA